MIKKIFLLLFFVVILTESFAQSFSPKVTPAAGGYSTGGAKSLSWTMGETFTQTLSASDGKLYQGFQQPVLLQLTNLKAFIQGYYRNYGSATPMDNLGAGGSLKVNGISSNIDDVDTVRVCLVDSATSSIISCKTGILKTNGSVSISFSSVQVGRRYYIQVSHRNSIETWCKSPVLINAITSYDFTTSNTQAFGNNQVEAEPDKWAFYSGDVNQDGVIESSDYSDVENALNVNLTGYVPTDVTGDGLVTADDYDLIETNVYFVVHSIHP